MQFLVSCMFFLQHACVTLHFVHSCIHMHTWAIYLWYLCARILTRTCTHAYLNVLTCCYIYPHTLVDFYLHLSCKSACNLLRNRHDTGTGINCYCYKVGTIPNSTVQNLAKHPEIIDHVQTYNTYHVVVNFLAWTARHQQGLRFATNFGTQADLAYLSQQPVLCDSKQVNLRS